MNFLTILFWKRIFRHAPGPDQRFLFLAETIMMRTLMEAMDANTIFQPICLRKNP